VNATGDLALLGRVMGGLIVVLVLVGLVAKVAVRARRHSGDSGLRVVDRVGLSREANLAVVEVSNRVLLLGVTAQGVTMLADLDGADHYSDAHRNALHHDVIHPDVIESEAIELNEGHPNASRTTHSEVDLAVTPAGPYRQQMAGVQPSAGTGVQPATGTRVQPAAGIRPVPVPAGISLDQYPDLASALRAAGRTAGPATGSSRAGSSPTGSSPTAGSSPTVGSDSAGARSRASNRRRHRSRDADAAGANPAAGAGSIQNSRRVVPKTQASGSVLSPRTWRQGIDALRDLTVRRG
jgi:flagellar biogenesis protein FliO